MSDTIRTPSALVPDTAVLFLVDAHNFRRVAELATGETHRIAEAGALCSLSRIPHVLQISDTGKAGWKSVVAGTHVAPGQWVRVQFYHRTF